MCVQKPWMRSRRSGTRSKPWPSTGLSTIMRTIVGHGYGRHGSSLTVLSYLMTQRVSIFGPPVWALTFLTRIPCSGFIACIMVLSPMESPTWPGRRTPEVSRASVALGRRSKPSPSSRRPLSRGACGVARHTDRPRQPTIHAHEARHRGNQPALPRPVADQRHTRHLHLVPIGGLWPSHGSCDPIAT